MKQLTLFIIISLSFSPLFAKEQFSSDQLQQMAFNRLKHMSLKEKIGQKLMLDFSYWCVVKPSNNQPCTEEFTQINTTVKNILSNNHIGGVILFSANIKNSAQITTLTHELQQVMAET
ncbi:MAG: hypothetical protein K2X39_09695, partial [Silvanigrellaceae bacterium]|nr:hypothetical protein [Silvanigrellaceae bacterium]